MTSPAVERAIRILEYLTTHRGQAFTLSEISRALRISKATAHAILGVLTANGYLVRDPDTQRYRVGAALIPVASSAESLVPAFPFAQEEARGLAARLRVQSIVVWATARELVYLAHFGTGRAGAFTARAGQRLPLVPPLGTVFIAWATEDRVQAWLESLGPGTAQPELRRYDAALDEVRRRGYAVGFRADAYARLSDLYSSAPAEIHTAEMRTALDSIMVALRQEAYLGDNLEEAADLPLANISVPIFDAAARPVLALSLHLDTRFTGSDAPALAEEVLTSAAAVMDRIDGRRPNVGFAIDRR
jgi:DNA-binding IclR family transcriptional regulator